MRGGIVAALLAFEQIVLLYFLAINTLYLLFSIVAFLRLRHQRRRWTIRELDSVIRSPATPGISVVAPAYNEAATIAESLHGLLLLNYPQLEVICVNDGSKDETLGVCIQAFNLVQAPVAYDQPIPTAAVRGVYRSLTNSELVLIDKENGGKADAMNAGINAARFPLVCVIDADSLLEEHALTRGMLPFIEDPATVAAGGIIRVANGCRVEAGRVVDVRMPENWLARFQVVEYLRAFVAGRVAHSAMNSLLIISGAFGIFRRDIVVGARGFRSDTIGEDMELVVRLHREHLARGERYRIVYDPDPVCWTEAPEVRRDLANQRNRWQRGTLQVLSYHWDMIGQPRYGRIGFFALPYYLVFEALGPLIEAAGYGFMVVALPLGLVDWRFAELMFLTAVVYGTLISLTAVALEEITFRRYARLRDLLMLMLVGVVENFGYRQLTTWWRLRGVYDFVRGKGGWGAMTRKGFSAS